MHNQDLTLIAGRTMYMLKGQRLVLLSVVCVSVRLIWPWIPRAQAQEKAKEKAGQTEKVTLQYRVARDAVAPSRFVAVRDKGISGDITWDLSKAEDKKKKEFDALIKKLEDKQINGVEFECKGEWLMTGAVFRLTPVPQLTEEGKKRIKESAR